MDRDVRDYLEKCKEDADQLKSEITFKQGKLNAVESTIDWLQNIVDKTRAVRG